jgi:hypothetical protein
MDLHSLFLCRPLQYVPAAELGDERPRGYEKRDDRDDEEEDEKGTHGIGQTSMSAMLIMIR